MKYAPAQADNYRGCNGLHAAGKFARYCCEGFDAGSGVAAAVRGSASCSAFSGLNQRRLSASRSASFRSSA